MAQIFGGIAILAGGVYFGSTWYMTFVELPVLRSLLAEDARAYWVQSVKRTPRYAASALVAASAALIAGQASLLSSWSWGALAIFSILPFTVIAILPVQRRLLEDSQPDWTIRLSQWSRLQAVRTALGLTSMILFLCAALAHRV